MKLQRLRVLLLFACFSVLSFQSSYADDNEVLIWHWKSSFTPAQKSKLQTWIKNVHSTVTEKYGDFPFPVHIHFYKARWAREPVPWANTQRHYNHQALHFHVDAHASLNEFYADWTAAHEISHLLLPYLGQSKRWFAEGFASYMQYKIMAEMGVISDKQKWHLYRSHFNKARRRYVYGNTPFALAASQLAADRNYPTMYWGGATYFLNTEYMLRQESKDFDEVISDYLACCRMRTKNIESLLSQLDAVSSTTHFQSNYSNMEKDLGFPNVEKALEDLKQAYSK